MAAFPEAAKKPVIILGVGGLIGLGYTVYRDKKNPPAEEATGDPEMPPAQTAAGFPGYRLTGGYAGTGMNTNVAPPTQVTQPPATVPPPATQPPPATVPPPAVEPPPLPPVASYPGGGGPYDPAMGDTTGGSSNQDFYGPLIPTYPLDPPMVDTIGGRADGVYGGVIVNAGEWETPPAGQPVPENLNTGGVFDPYIPPPEPPPSRADGVSGGVFDPSMTDTTY